jgi:predicted dehydrogenase
MLRKIGLGIIGYGFMGKTHILGARSIPLFYDGIPFVPELRGICTPNRQAAAEACARLGVEFYTDNVDALLARGDIDAVAVSTPNAFHREHVLKALAAGKHVYCDKPLATDAACAREMADEAKRRGVTAQMVMHNRFFPATLRAKQLMDEGKIGDITAFRGAYLHSGSVDPARPIGWKQDEKFGGGGVLLDLGSHVLDLLYSLLGKYSEVFACTRILYPQRPLKTGDMTIITAEDAAYMILKLKDGTIGTVEVTKIATGTSDELRIEIHGDKGALRFNLMDPNWLEYYDNTLPEADLGGERGFRKIECVQRYAPPGGKFPTSKSSIGWLRGHVHCLYNFLHCVYESKPATPSLDDGAYIQYVMEKAYESSRMSKWVAMSC